MLFVLRVVLRRGIMNSLDDELYVFVVYFGVLFYLLGVRVDDWLIKEGYL